MHYGEVPRQLELATVPLDSLQSPAARDKACDRGRAIGELGGGRAGRALLLGSRALEAGAVVQSVTISSFRIRCARL